jgi:hypothetical protein
MLEWLKTSSGAYNLTFIVALTSWLVGGIGLIAGFHLNKIKTVEAELKAKSAESQRAELASKLEISQVKTAELEKRLAPRQFTAEQRARFISALAKAPKGPVTIVYSDRQQETVKFVDQMKSLIIDAGFEVPTTPEYTFAYTIQPPGPWFISLVAITGAEPAYARPIHLAFQAIGIENGYTDGLQFSQPGELKVYVGSK